MDGADPSLAPSGEQVERFRRALDLLIPADTRLGIAVSGGPDSLALLLLAAAARPGAIEAASVDHALREGSRAEAQMVGTLARRLGLPQAILTVEWPSKPETALQERARRARYGLLSEWARERGLGALATAHHLDDQAETFLMRLARGAGVRGLGGIRPVTRLPGGLALVRPLLDWRRSELEQLCAAAGATPTADPSNEDERFERVRLRKALAEADWLDPAAIARSASNLARADAALDWATDLEWARAVIAGPSDITYRPTDAPLDIRRRIARRSVLRLASEGGGSDLRGDELDRLVTVLTDGGKATLRGVLCAGGEQWRFTRAPPRNG